MTIGVKVYTWLDAAKAALEESGDGDRLPPLARGGRGDAGDLLAVLSQRLAPDGGCAAQARALRPVSTARARRASSHS